MCANTQNNGEGTQPPFKIVFHYASGIRDFSRMRFWDEAAAEQYGEERMYFAPEATEVGTTFHPDTWASIVAFVSAGGENAETFNRAGRFHAGSALSVDDPRYPPEVLPR